MSFRALPLQFLNLGGEMMYILDQRLRAQNISPDRAHKVRNDIISIMLSQHFVEEIFHPQPLYSKPALKTVFYKLAHASIMKLNAPSMDKLFDLMLMSLKHQVSLVPQARDLFSVTMNHLDSIMDFATDQGVLEQVRMTRFYFIKIYSSLRTADWLDIRRDLLMFTQDTKTRVSLFLKNGVQDHFGQLIVPTHGLVPSGCEIPGTIRFFNSSGEVSLVTLFPNGGSYCACAVETVLACAEVGTDRLVRLGLNMYLDAEKESFELYNDPTPTEVSYRNFGPDNTTEESEQVALAPDDATGKGREELNLLATLIGTKMASCSDNKEFRLNLFLGDEGCAQDSSGDASTEITIEGAVREKPAELGRILGELSFEDPTLPQDQEEDEGLLHQELLDLLDSA